MELTKLESLKEKLVKATERFVSEKHEFSENTEPISLEISQFVNNGINSDDESKMAAQLCARGNKEIKKIAEARLDLTRVYDSVKKDYMEVEDEITRSLREYIKTVTQKNNQYLSDKEEKLRKERERIELEKNQDIERNMLPLRIENAIQTALNEEISSLNQKMHLSWASLTVDTFEERIGILKNFKPKVTYDKVLEYFNFNTQYLTEDEVEGIIRKNFDYNKFCVDFDELFINVKKYFTDNIESKREELKNQSESERKALEQKTQEELINKKAQEIADKKAKERELELKESNQKIKSEMTFGMKTGAIPSTSGRTKWNAYIISEVDWNKIISLYLKDNGADKLEFLLSWLCQNGRPEIKGIKYESSKTVINRI